MSPALVLLLTVTMVTAAQAAALSPDIPAYFTLLKTITNIDDPPATKLLWDAVRIAKDYLCTVGSSKCDGLRLFLLENDLEQISCEEAPDQAACVEAREILGADQDISNKELKSALIAYADRVYKESHQNFMTLDKVRIGLIDLICDTEADERCKKWRFSFELLI